MRPTGYAAPAAHRFRSRSSESGVVRTSDRKWLQNSALAIRAQEFRYTSGFLKESR